MQSVTEQDLLEALFASMPQAQDRPPGAFLGAELYEYGQASGFRIGRNSLMRKLRAGVEQGVIELIEVKVLNVRGNPCQKPMYRLKNSSDIKTVV